MPKLPDFRALTRAELRELWTKHPDPDVRRLILEVERGRQQMAEIESICESIKRAWQNNGGENLVALHRLKLLLSDERDRRAE